MKRVPLFMRDFMENILLCIVAAGIETTSKRFTDRIATGWRQILTTQIHRKYFDNMVCHCPVALVEHMSIDALRTCVRSLHEFDPIHCCATPERD